MSEEAELQADLPLEETEHRDLGSDSAPDSQRGDEQTAGEHAVGTPEYTENVQKAINRKHFEAMEQKRRADLAERKLAELEQQQQVPEQRPAVIDMPDSLDDDYEQQLAIRDQQLIERARYDERLEQQQQQVIQQQRAAVQAQAQEIQNAGVEFQKRAVQQGVDSSQLQMGVQVMAALQIQPQLMAQVLQDENGPMIAAYLGENPIEAEKLAGMNVLNAAVHLATEVKSQASKMKPKLSETPPPTETERGSGVPPRDRGPRGAKFE